ncbi:uncharacterized protein LOC108250091 [Kryptolebias marmoratus]|uniref:uncharacterized protein LOC108250091 n=1 Tax=Kryptolebias marmoratus TaxID=37003 RepID=UPI0007F86538|nr:uncharacterized protein LOC108250091 [Kryptolebias marmoratus]XP_037831839.1 uncharacterized protein LOC108250091 [Kryptolebias marmoratus]
MDLSAVVIIAAFSLVTTGLAQTQTPEMTNTREPNSTSAWTLPNAVSVDSAAPTSCSTSNSNSSSSAPITGLLTVTWTNECEGTLHLVPYLPSNSSLLLVCKSSYIQKIMKDVCQNKKGCESVPSWKNTGRNKMEGYSITEKGASKVSDCKMLMITCKAKVLPDVQTQLQVYKVMTALLSCVLVVLFLIRFTRPTVTALQKRLSDRRQHRWIGPTQSHSVSYHRGKTAVENSEEKRSSYPALERLTIDGSSSPSCSRANFYNI